MRVSRARPRTSSRCTFLRHLASASWNLNAGNPEPARAHLGGRGDAADRRPRAAAALPPDQGPERRAEVAARPSPDLLDFSIPARRAAQMMDLQES
jgi:hypothetical protein